MVEETPIRVTLPACGTVVAIERSATVIAARQDTLCDANDLMNVRLVASAVSALLVASEPTSRGHPVNKLIDPSATVAPQKRKIAEMRTYQNRVSTSPRIKYARDLHGTKVGCPAFSGLLNLRSLCGELRIQVFGADFARCPVAECGVNSSLIVEQFDVAGNVLLRFLP